MKKELYHQNYEKRIRTIALAVVLYLTIDKYEVREHNIYILFIFQSTFLNGGFTTKITPSKCTLIIE